MLKKLRNGKGVKIILVVSMVGIGSVSYIPTTYAAMNQTAVSPTLEEQNTLSKLEIDGVPFDQVFSPDVYEYTTTAENSVQQTTLNIESLNPQAIITINGQPVINGTAGPFPLKTGENLFTIIVDDGTRPANTYKLKVTRKQNSNNLLKNIKLSKGQLLPAFNPSIVDYNLSLPNETAALTITPEAFEKTSRIQINNQLYKDEGIAVSLPVGKSDVPILVTAENGDKKTYTLHITRAIKQYPKPPVSPGKPGINQSGNGSHNPGQSNQSGNGSHSPGQSNQSGNGSNNGTYAKNPNQSAGKNNSTWKNATTSQNGTASQNVTAIQKVSKATLSSLTVSNGTWNKAFTKSAYTYHVAESNNIKTVTIVPAVTYSSSTIKIDGSTSRIVNLDGNKTTISVVITNGDERKTYVLVFDKKQPKSVVKTEAVNSTDVTVSSTSGSTSANNNSMVQSPAWNGTNNNTSTSFWGRLVDSVSAFFKKVF